MSNHSSTAGVLYPITAYLGISLACTQIPLLNYLGFEFSLVVALSGSLISGLRTAGSLHRWLHQNNLAKGREVSAEFARQVFWNLALLSIPVLIMLANALFVRNCSFAEGLAFFLLLPVVSICFSTALAFFCAAHYRHPKTIFLLMVTASLLYGVAVGYFTPAIYSYNFFYGFFPGLTYDELLEISGTLVIFRCLTLILSYLLYRTALLILDSGSVGRSTWEKGIDLLRSLAAPGNRLTSLAVFLLLFAVFHFRTTLGFESPSSFIRSELGSSFATQNFTLFYAESTYTREEILWLGAEHEFRLMQIGSALDHPFKGKIESYIYPDTDLKRRYIGAGATSIAKPWNGEIHLHADAVGDVLKHELVHLAAAPFGLPFLHASLHPGLTEGLAMAIEWNWGDRTLHEYSSAMIRSGLAPEMEPVMQSFGFTQQSSSVSYVLAGSFCRFLLDRYGATQLTALYSSGDYEAIFGKPLTALLADWKEMLAGIPLDEGMSEVVGVYFQPAPFFTKTCVRVSARKLSAARREFRKHSYSAAAGLYDEVYGETRSVEALGGLVASHLRLGQTSPILSVRDSINRLESPGRLLPLYLPIGDALWMEERTKEARESYERLLRANLNRTTSESALIRIHASRDSLSTSFRSFLLSDQPDSLRVSILDSILASHPGHPLGLYLRGKLMLRRGKYEDAVRNLDEANILAIDIRFESRRRIARGDSLFRLRRFREARDSYVGALATDDSPALVDEMKDRAERCEWFDQNGMPDALLPSVGGGQ